MATLYIYCLHLIIPEADRDAANAMAADLGEDYVGTFTDANVSADGVYPPTHIYVSARMRQDERDAFAAILPNWATYGLSAMPQFWTIDATNRVSGALLASNTSAASVGQPWGVAEQNTFAAAGLAWTAFPEE